MKDKEQRRTPSKVVARRIRDVGQSSKMTTLVYGRSGTGKTTFAASMLDFLRKKDQDAKVLLVDMNEEGEDSIANVKGIKVFIARNWNDVEGVFYYLRGGNHPYKGYICDTVTQMQAMAFTEAKKRAGDGEDETMSRRGWGHLSGMLIPTLLDYRNLPYHGCFVAQDRRDELDEEVEESDIIPEVGPAVMPSVAKTLNAMVKIIANTFIQQKTMKVKVKGSKIPKLKKANIFRMRVGPHPFYLTKVRTPKGSEVPQMVTDPTWEMIYNIMKGNHSRGKE